MKILTVSASPYVLTALGRFNAGLIKFLKDNGDEVSSLVWDHPSGYFLPDSSNKFFYEVNGENVCQLYTFSGNHSKASVEAYDVVRTIHPDLVVSIGNYFQAESIYGVKSLNPNLFRWVAVLTSGFNPIEEKYKEIFDYIDYAAVLSMNDYMEFSKLSPTPVDHIGPCYDNEEFYPDGEVKSFNIVANLKNSQFSNIPCLIDALSKLKNNKINFKAYLHTNLSDNGFYDIPSLINRYGLGTYIKLPDRFTTTYYGVSDAELRRIYSEASVLVDPSSSSSTAMTILEAMACGCIPLAVKTGVAGDILAMLPKLCSIESTPYIGERLCSYEIAQPDSLYQKLVKIYEDQQKVQKDKHPLRMKCIEIAQRFQKDKFELEASRIVEEVMKQKIKLAVDVLR